MKDKKDKKQAPPRVYRLGSRKIDLGEERWTLIAQDRDGSKSHRLEGKAEINIVGPITLWLSDWTKRTPFFGDASKWQAEIAQFPPWPLEAGRWAVAGINLIDSRTGEFADRKDPEAGAAQEEVDNLIAVRLMRAERKRAHEQDRKKLARDILSVMWVQADGHSDTTTCAMLTTAMDLLEDHERRDLPLDAAKLVEAIRKRNSHTPARHDLEPRAKRTPKARKT